MKTQVVTPRVRFICQIVRYSSALSGREPAHHLAACADCQAFFRASHALEDNLRREAVEATPVISAGLERRILQAARTSAAEAASESEPHGAVVQRWWIGATASAVLAAAMVVLLWPGRSTIGLGPTAAPAREEAAAVASAVQTLSTQFVESVLPTTGELVANNPLQQEAESIYADARSALGFLAMNFLPPRAEPPRPRSG